MDIMLDKYGDMIINQETGIVLAESVAQKIRIKLLWLENEWRWNPDEGLPYLEDLLIKNPNISYFTSRVRQKILEVEEILYVEECEIKINKETRMAVIKFTAVTDQETISDEVAIGWNTE